MKTWKFKYYDSEKNTVDWDNLNHLEWISDMHGIDQDLLWHAEGNVYKHTKMVVEALINFPEFQNLEDENKHILVTSALMHDVEKRTCSVLENDRVRTPNHSKKGATTANIILYKEITTPTLVRRNICNLVRLHGLPLNILDKSDPNRYVIDSSLKVNNYHLYLLSKADTLGRISSDIDELIEKLEYFKEYCINNECFFAPKQFASDYARYKFLSEKNCHVDYVPFDETKFNVILMSGVAGSGKDKYIKDNLSTLPVVSIDDIRRLHNIKPTDKVGNGRAIQMAKEQAKVHMRVKEDFIWNATNITKQMRSQLIDLFLSYGGSVTIIYVEKPYETLLNQNSNREYVVPVNVVEKMINKLEFPEYDEATKILYV